MTRARKSNAKGGPEHQIALPCVIVAIDPGRASGWAIYLEGRPVSWGVVDAADSLRVQNVLIEACRLAQIHRLPLVLLGETWNVGGTHSSPATWQGLGAAWGAWKYAAEHLSSSRRDQPGSLGPQLVASRILRVSTSTWRARFGMMHAPKEAPTGWYKAMALQLVERELGVEVAPEHHDAAEALLIGLWGTRAQAVGKKLPARVMKARGLDATLDLGIKAATTGGPAGGLAQNKTPLPVTRDF